MSNVRAAIKTQPASEPLTTAEAKAQLRWTHSSEDSLVDSFVAAARAHLENLTSIAFISQTWQSFLPHWPNGAGPFNHADPLAIRLARSPVSAITHIKYDDTDGNQQTLASSVYELETAGRPALIRLAYDQSWPDIRASANCIEVEYVVGSADADAFEAAYPDMLHALRLLVGSYANNREAVVTGTIATSLPLGVQALIRPYVNW